MAKLFLSCNLWRGHPDTLVTKIRNAAGPFFQLTPSDRDGRIQDFNFDFGYRIYCQMYLGTGVLRVPLVSSVLLSRKSLAAWQGFSLK